MNDREVALLLTIGLTLILSIVQISVDSKISNIKSYFTIQLAFYISIMVFGNAMSTLLAEAIIQSADKQKVVFVGPSWFWYSAIGVFGFEAIIQKLNLTLFDKGILSLSDWITKAKSIAVAATLEKAADLSTDAEHALANRLYKSLNGIELHTHLLTILGSDLYNNALSSIANSQQINKELYLATIASTQAPRKVIGLIKTYEKN